MKENKLTPGSNLLWESSRMMLPEHVSAIQEMQRNSLKKQKPELDEQRIEELARSIAEAHFKGEDVRIEVFGKFENRYITGKITKLDLQLKQVKVEHGENYEWIRLEDILQIDA